MIPRRGNKRGRDEGKYAGYYGIADEQAKPAGSGEERAALRNTRDGTSAAQQNEEKAPPEGVYDSAVTGQGEDSRSEAALRRAADHGDKLRRSGEVVAALLSLLFGMAALTGAHWWSAADPGRANMTLLRFGSWLPNGLRIGPYGGKELAALAVWLGSWGLLLLLLGRRRFSLKPWMYAFVAGVFVLLLLLWPPVYHRIYGWPA